MDATNNNNTHNFAGRTCSWSQTFKDSNQPICNKYDVSTTFRQANHPYKSWMCLGKDDDVTCRHCNCMAE